MPLIPYTGSFLSSSTSSLERQTRGAQGDAENAGNLHGSTRSSNSNSPNTFQADPPVDNSEVHQENEQSNSGGSYASSNHHQPLLRKISMSNTIHGLVNSIRPLSTLQSSSRHRNRSASQSSPRSRSSSLLQGQHSERSNNPFLSELNDNLPMNLSENELDILGAAPNVSEGGIPSTQMPDMSVRTQPYIQVNLDEATRINRSRRRADSQTGSILGSYPNSRSSSHMNSRPNSHPNSRSGSRQQLSMNPFSADNTNTGNSIVITNMDTNAHNTFNPAVYTYNMANSETVANFQMFLGEEEEFHNLRTRGNTLRGEDNLIPEAITGHEDVLPNTIIAGDEDTRPDNNEFQLNERMGEGNEENRVGTIYFPTSENNGEGNSNVGVGQTGGVSASTHAEQVASDSDGFYSIRFTPSIDHSSTHPYMFFGPIVRKLKPGMNISIGRYTEKSKAAATAAAGSSESVVFKSKVVSRQHAELTVDDKGKWYIKDVKSSSGTFLNHVRLSPPNCESAKVYLRDGDVLQLGVDYRGGSEEMYRCVKLKVELNDSWRKRAAKFSKEAHEKLKNLTNKSSGEELTACVICLDDIRPCQAVFVSSCSHSWHYRCIRPLLVKTYPQFLCPNCKAVCDLEADPDDFEDA